MQNRPIFLNLCAIRFPITAIVSIGHRLTGLWLFLLIPLLLKAFEVSLKASSHDIAIWLAYLEEPYIKVLLWTFLVAGSYHVVAGLRHLAMDCGYGESLWAAKLTARLLLGLMVGIAVFVGYSLW